MVCGFYFPVYMRALTCEAEGLLGSSDELFPFSRREASPHLTSFPRWDIVSWAGGKEKPLFYTS